MCRYMPLKILHGSDIDISKVHTTRVKPRPPSLPPLNHPELLHICHCIDFTSHRATKRVKLRFYVDSARQFFSVFRQHYWQRSCKKKRQVIRKRHSGNTAKKIWKTLLKSRIFLGMLPMRVTPSPKLRNLSLVVQEQFLIFLLFV